jgi:hypothetical protein
MLFMPNSARWHLYAAKARQMAGFSSFAALR